MHKKSIIRASLKKDVSLRWFCKSNRNYQNVFNVFNVFPPLQKLRTLFRKAGKIVFYMYQYKALINGAANRRSGFIFHSREHFFSFGNKKKSQGSGDRVSTMDEWQLWHSQTLKSLNNFRLLGRCIIMNKMDPVQLFLVFGLPERVPSLRHGSPLSNAFAHLRTVRK